MRPVHPILLALLLDGVAAAAGQVPAPELAGATNQPSRFRSAEAGWRDVSGLRVGSAWARP
jgi:hypothetical protein